LFVLFFRLNIGFLIKRHINYKHASQTQMKKILIATHNQGKFSRFSGLISEIQGIECISLKDAGISHKVDEPFENALDNAILKVRGYSRLSGLPTLAVDEAVITNFLPENEQPGVFIRRARKDRELTDLEIIDFWKETFSKYKNKDKKFIWNMAIAFCPEESSEIKFTHHTREDRVSGHFSKNFRTGYPMDSFLIFPDQDRPVGDLSNEEKLASDKKSFKDFIEDFKKWIS